MGGGAPAATRRDDAAASAAAAERSFFAERIVVELWVVCAQQRNDALAPAPLGVDPEALRAALQAQAFASQEVHVVPRMFDLAESEAFSVALAAALRTEFVALRRGGGDTVAAVPRPYIDAHALQHQLSVSVEHEHSRGGGAVGGQQRDGSAGGDARGGDGAARERILPVILLSLNAADGEAPLLLGPEQRAAVALSGMVIAVQALHTVHFSELDDEGRGAERSRNLRDPSDAIIAAAASALFDLPVPTAPCPEGGWCLAPSAPLVSSF